MLTGRRLGPYEILIKLGEGGMGEVYKARDTRLNRTVAVKVLPQELAGDPDRRARFEREAHAIAALSHPHICVVHDIGRDNGTDYLVMELLEGETLADKLASGSRLRASAGRALPINDALRYATEIADALDKAHRAGIVHRDLKPANIMLTKSGVKLLDFGLAKLKGPAVPISMTAIEHATTTGGPKTATGTILGTIHYMAPEQVEGREADARGDIWALGVVIYEMATGSRPFDGESPASIIGAILKDTPAPLSNRQPLAPPSLEFIVERCLEKDPDERWQNAGDVKRTLLGLKTVSTQPVAATAAVRRGMWPLALGVGALLLLTVAGGAAWRFRSVETPPASAARFQIYTPANVSLSPAPVASAAQLALSPDGNQIVFVAAQRHGLSQLWVRALDDLTARPLGGTEGASYPFWSPDGRYIGFFASGKLKKVDVSGGSPQVLCPAASGRGGTWNTDGTIVFGAAAYSPLSRVSAVGGTPTAATTFEPDRGIVSHYWPEFLSDGRHFLYYQRSAKPEYEGIYVSSLDSTTTSTKVIEAHARTVHTNGYLLYVREGSLLAQAFDETKLQVFGEPVRLGDGVGYFQSSYGYASMTATPRVVAYGPTVAPTTKLQWHDQRGTVTDSIATGVYTGPRISPDGQSVIVSARESGSLSADIWLLDLAHRNPSRLTTDPLNDWFPTWSSDSRRIFFGSTREGNTNIFTKLGVSPEEKLLNFDLARYPNDVSADGKTLLYTQSSPGGYDLGSTLLSDRKLAPLLNTPSNELQGRFSPDGRWVAYTSDESGEFEVYVIPFPAPDTRYKISTAGGMQPEWRSDGKELFYVSNDSKLMAVSVTTNGQTFEHGAPHSLFDVDMPEAIQPYPGHYAVAADGQRFLINSVADVDTRPALTVLLNWTSASRK